MRLLLDTHLFIWALNAPEKLSKAMRALIEDPTNDIVFSAASIWEIAIKSGLGRVDFAIHPEKMLQTARQIGFTELPVRAEVALRVAKLPPLHRDPFDRLLVAQAMAEPVRLYTSDPVLPPYSDLVEFVG